MGVVGFMPLLGAAEAIEPKKLGGLVPDSAGKNECDGNLSPFWLAWSTTIGLKRLKLASSDPKRVASAKLDYWNRIPSCIGLLGVAGLHATVELSQNVFCFGNPKTVMQITSVPWSKH